MVQQGFQKSYEFSDMLVKANYIDKLTTYSLNAIFQGDTLFEAKSYAHAKQWYEYAQDHFSHLKEITRDDGMSQSYVD